MNFYLNNKKLTWEQLEKLSVVPGEDYYLISNGRRMSFDNLRLNGDIHIIPTVLGGKGGFGSMLRAIGAQIEKTTNREACRDLSGRRLRDINEEKRLKQWIANQGEREKETADKKQKKLEKLCEEPKHVFRDSDYDKLRSVLPEKVEDAVVQGLKASCSSKRKNQDDKTIPKKKPKLWFDDPEVSGSDLEDSSDDEEIKEKPKKLETEPEEVDEPSSQMTTKEIVQT